MIHQTSNQSTIRFEVPNFTQISEITSSKAVWLHNIPWKIRIEENTLENKLKYLGYYLHCDVKSDSDKDWSCQAKAELRMINHKNLDTPFIMQIRHLFTSQEYTWGYKEYKLWTNVTDPEKGFIKENTVTFEVKLVADPPTGNNVLLVIKKRPSINYVVSKSEISNPLRVVFFIKI